MSPLLVLAPHPDDETLGCGGLLAEAATLGLEPKVAFLTDGAASHRGSPTWPPARLAARRRQEARAALGVLGVAEPDSLFLDWPDAAPPAPGSIAYETALASLAGWVQAAQIRSLWVTPADDPHCDHQAANGLARDLRNRLPAPPALFEYFVWTTADAAPAQRRDDASIWALPCAQHADRRRAALACHRTQLGGVIEDAAEAFTLGEDIRALAGRPIEHVVQVFP